MEDYIEEILEHKDLESELLDVLDMAYGYSPSELSELLASNSELFDSSKLY
jgi:hypothetical protein